MMSSTLYQNYDYFLFFHLFLFVNIFRDFFQTEYQYLKNFLSFLSTRRKVRNLIPISRVRLEN